MQGELDIAIIRIQKMEFYYDTLQNALDTFPDLLKEDEYIRGMVDSLSNYFESGEWLADFELDESDGVPNDLKRGVLSEDGLYNLLSEIDELLTH